MADEEEAPVTEAVGETVEDVLETVEEATSNIEETVTEAAGEIGDSAMEEIRAELATVKSAVSELREKVEGLGSVAAAPVEAVDEGFAEVEAPASPEPPAEERKRKRVHDLMRKR